MLRQHLVCCATLVTLCNQYMGTPSQNINLPLGKDKWEAMKMLRQNDLNATVLEVKV